MYSVSRGHVYQVIIYIKYWHPILTTFSKHCIITVQSRSFLIALRAASREIYVKLLDNVPTYNLTDLKKYILNTLYQNFSS
jgi:hypothetical protein